MKRLVIPMIGLVACLVPSSIVFAQAAATGAAATPAPAAAPAPAVPPAATASGGADVATIQSNLQVLAKEKAGLASEDAKLIEALRAESEALSKMMQGQSAWSVVLSGNMTPPGVSS